MGGMLCITWSDPLEAIDFWCWWDPDSEGQFAAWYLWSKTLTRRQTRAPMSSSLVTPAALPDEVGLRHKTRQEPQEELCRQRKRDEGLRRWLSQHTSGRAAPDAGEPSKPRHAEAPRRPGKSCAEGRPRTQGAALAVWEARSWQRDLLWLALPKVQLSNFQTGSNKPSLISLTPNANTVRKTRLEMEVVYHKEFTKQKRRASFSTSQRVLTEIKTGVRSISLEEVAASLSGHVGKVPKAQGNPETTCTAALFFQISLCLNMPSFNFYKWGKKKK